MGYYVCGSMTRGHDFIKVENIPAANEVCGGSVYDTLHDSGWHTDTDNAGNICDIIYEYDKWHSDDCDVLDKIAPFVEDGALIEMLGDDGEKWAYFFHMGECMESYGETIYPEIEEFLK